ncbi:MAG: hypothetical protein NZ585_02950 [Chloracidobacterium sp.]|nr:hypothetical protein [Chloracidobacterium sp.]MDW8218825.1 hypothetical protein [Acidobacteriota bacterium]
MATTKTTKKTTRKSTSTASPKARSKAAQRLSTQPASRPPFEVIAEAVLRGVRLGIGTTLVVRDNIQKFFADAEARGNAIELTAPQLPTFSLPKLPGFGLPTAKDIERQVGKLSEASLNQIKPIAERLQKFFDALARRLADTATSKSKKAVLDREALREEVLNVVASLDLANGSDIKRILNQVEKMSRKLDREAKAAARRKVEPVSEPAATPATA